MERREIIDVHVHPLKRIVSVEEIIREMDRAGVVKAVLLAMDTDPGNLDRVEIKKRIMEKTRSIYIWNYSSLYLQMKKILYYAKTTNEYVASLVSKYPEKFTGFGSVDLCKDREYFEREMGKIVKLKLRGVKILPTLQFFHPLKNKNVKRVWEWAERNNLIIMFHSGCDPGPWELTDLSSDANPKYIEPLIEKYNVPVIIAHCGSYSSSEPGIWLKETLELVKEHDDVWLDLSSVGYLLREEEVVEMFREYRVFNNLLFGSDFPVLWGMSISDSVNYIENSPFIQESEKERVFFKNAARLFKFK